METFYDVYVKDSDSNYCFYHSCGGFESIESAKAYIEEYISKTPNQVVYFQIVKCKPVLETYHKPHVLEYRSIP